VTTPKKNAINCRHNSICRVGNKEYVIHNKTTWWTDDNVDSGTYCDCNEDFDTLSDLSTENERRYTGLRCTREFKICPDKSVCFHGAPCIEKKRNINNVIDPSYVCGCQQTTVPQLRFAGESCLERSTDFCEEGDLNGTDLQDWFCTNSGICKNGETNIAKKCQCNGNHKGHKCQLIGIDEEDPLMGKCDLDCKHGGQCLFGTKDYSHYPQYLQDMFPSQINGMHCICPSGYGDVLCNYQVSDCGKNICLNGAKCLTNSTEATDLCDCSTTKGPHNWAGKSCEHKQTMACVNDDDRDCTSLFCTNDGTCPTSDDSSMASCKCSSDWKGPHCEFKVESSSMPECDLQCQNGGECSYGSKACENLNSIRGNLIQDLKPSKHINGMHCICPQGFGGDYCHHDVEVCGNSHACLNGGVCVGKGSDVHCDCSVNSKNSLTTYAGHSCEFGATSFCSENGESWSCYNSGECRQEGSKTNKCVCEETFLGEFCENFLKASTKQGDKKDSNLGKIIFGVTTSIVLIALIISGVIKFLRYKRNTDDTGVNKPVLSFSFPPSPKRIVREYRDNKAAMSNKELSTYKDKSVEIEEEYELQDVQII